MKAQLRNRGRGRGDCQSPLHDKRAKILGVKILAACLPLNCARRGDANRGFGGEAETSGEANESIMVKLPLAGLIIVLLLVGQVNSLKASSAVTVIFPPLCYEDRLVNGSYPSFFQRYSPC